MSLVELSLGRYPIPQPTEAELNSIFGPNALQDHMEAAKTGKRLCGGISSSGSSSSSSSNSSIV